MPYESAFDAVFSNAALYWIRDADSVLRGVHRALKPSGRFVAEMGGHGNIVAIRTALLAVLAPYGTTVACSNKQASKSSPSTSFHAQRLSLTAWRPG